MNFSIGNSCTRINYSNCLLPQTCHKSKKMMVTEYATAKCKELGSILPVLDEEYSGLQAPHEEGWCVSSLFPNVLNPVIFEIYEFYDLKKKKPPGKARGE